MVKPKKVKLERHCNSCAYWKAPGVTRDGRCGLYRAVTEATDVCGMWKVARA